MVRGDVRRKGRGGSGVHGSKLVSLLRRYWLPLLLSSLLIFLLLALTMRRSAPPPPALTPHHPGDQSLDETKASTSSVNWKTIDLMSNPLPAISADLLNSVKQNQIVDEAVTIMVSQPIVLDLDQLTDPIC